MKPARPLGSPGSVRGAILLQVTFLRFALMGLFAVVVDMGIARTTQGFMQASADAAAMDGLRFRNLFPDDPALSELERRAAAARAAALVFDEDLDLSTGASAYLLGAGPTLETSIGGIDDPAGGLLVEGGPYLPLLQSNLDTNEPHGDLVAGSFAATDPLDPGNPDWHAEDGSYLRSDFTASSAADAPSARAFLARLRRTNDVDGLDEQAGISSRGETLPFLFGLGSASLSSDDPATYDPRRDGITVRATAIADARPALAAGLSGPLSLGLAVVGAAGATPRVLAFDGLLWETELAADGAFEMTISADGSIAGTPATLTGVAQPVAGYSSLGDPALVAPAAGSMVAAAPSTELDGLCYVALYDSTLGWVSGFASVVIESATADVDGDGNAVLILTGRKTASLVAPANASASPSLAFDLAALDVAAPGREPLLAPVLVR